MTFDDEKMTFQAIRDVSTCFSFIVCLIGGEVLTTLIACIIAGICATAFVALWFRVSYCVLADKYREVEATAEQSRMHYSNYRQERGNPNAEAAKRIFDTSRMIYRESLNKYNQVYSKPINRFPGMLMGFRIGKERDFT